MFELNIFIDCNRDIVYDHLSEPINMVGLKPRLTEIDILKEKRDAQGVLLRPFYTVETYRLLGLPLFRSRTYSVIHITEPREGMEIHVHARRNVEIIFKYRFRQLNDGRTQITQTLEVVKAGRLLEGFVSEQAKRAQRALLSNLKVRLEKR